MKTRAVSFSFLFILLLTFTTAVTPDPSSPCDATVVQCTRPAPGTCRCVPSKAGRYDACSSRYVEGIAQAFAPGGKASRKAFCLFFVFVFFLELENKNVRHRANGGTTRQPSSTSSSSGRRRTRTSMNMSISMSIRGTAYHAEEITVPSIRCSVSICVPLQARPAPCTVHCERSACALLCVIVPPPRENSWLNPTPACPLAINQNDRRRVH